MQPKCIPRSASQNLFAVQLVQSILLASENLTSVRIDALKGFNFTDILHICFGNVLSSHDILEQSGTELATYHPAIHLAHRSHFLRHFHNLPRGGLNDQLTAHMTGPAFIDPSFGLTELPSNLQTGGANSIVLQASDDMAILADRLFNLSHIHFNVVMKLQTASDWFYVGGGMATLTHHDIYENDSYVHRDVDLETAFTQSLTQHNNSLISPDCKVTLKLQYEWFRVYQENNRNIRPLEDIDTWCAASE